ncbi:probable myosin-binding protein 4 isoform X2 [Tripterygium wilfordii]|nr:probable myosin-binding protein 4 isoform X2 [Tripterygium wilfordii]
MRDKFSGSGTSHCLGKNGFDSLSHVGYTELKLTSDSESEVQFSDDDGGGGSVVRDTSESKEESTIRHAQETSSKALPGDMDSLKLRRDAHKPQGMKNHTSDVANGRNLVENKWLQDDQNAHPPALPELISLDDIPPLSCAVEVPVGLSTEKCALATPFSQNTNPYAISELLSLVDSSSCFTVGEVPVGASTSQTADISGTSEIRDISIDKHEVTLKSITTTTEADNRVDQAINEPSLINPSYRDQSDKCKSAVTEKETQALDLGSEMSMMNERERVNEELKRLPAQHNFGGGMSLSPNNTNPNAQVDDNKSQVTDASSSTGLQMLTAAFSMERTESLGLESLDGSVVSDIEGESIVDKFKRQVDYDHKCINALYKELEEERSASAIAANQAMAMITRLQAEKASLHMEALQYLRMMEEQAEYDVEALEKANDLLAEKEKEIQDLEAELEYFRLKFLDEYGMESTAGEIDPLEKNINTRNESESCIKDAIGVPCKLLSTEVSNNGKKVTDIQSAWSEFEDEKVYISECLKNLEWRVHQLAHRGPSNRMSDSQYSEAAADQEHDGEESVDDNGFWINGRMEESSLPMQNSLPVSNTGHSADNEQRNFQKDNDLRSSGQKSSSNSGEIDVVALENEISDLHERLEALEADCNLIEHTLNAVQDGNEGVKYIQEIAHHLQKLRKIGRESKSQSVP